MNEPETTSDCPSPITADQRDEAPEAPDKRPAAPAEAADFVRYARRERDPDNVGRVTILRGRVLSSQSYVGQPGPVLELQLFPLTPPAGADQPDRPLPGIGRVFAQPVDPDNLFSAGLGYPGCWEPPGGQALIGTDGR